MNRRQRRPGSAAANIAKLQKLVETTGRPGRIDGLTDACRDCHATGSMLLLPGRRIIGEIFHDDGCPAAAGVTEWQPHPIDRQESA